MIFIDTNVLVYAAMVQSPAKNQRANEVILELQRNGTGVISLQILREFANALFKKAAFPADAIKNWVDAMGVFPLAAETSETLYHAIQIKARYGLQFYDALVVATAKGAGCDTVYSEDMGDGEVYDGVRIVNPFRES